MSKEKINFYEELYDYLTNLGYNFYSNFDGEDFVIIHPNIKDINDLDGSKHVYIDELTRADKDSFSYGPGLSHIGIYIEKDVSYWGDYENFIFDMYVKYPEHRNDLFADLMPTDFFNSFYKRLNNKNDILDFVVQLPFRDNSSLKTSNVLEDIRKLPFINESDYFVILKKFYKANKTDINHDLKFPYFRDFILNIDNNQIFIDYFRSKSAKFNRFFETHEIKYDESYSNKIVLNINKMHHNFNIDFISLRTYLSITEALVRKIIQSNNIDKDSYSVEITSPDNDISDIHIFSPHPDKSSLSFEFKDLNLSKTLNKQTKEIIDAYFNYIKEFKLTYETSDINLIDMQEPFINSYLLNKSIVSNDLNKSKKIKI